MPLSRNCSDCLVKGPLCFCSLDQTVLGRLDGIGTRIVLAPGARVLQEGATPDRVYVLCHGAIKLSTSSSDGRLLILRIAGPGDVLGLAAALKQSRYEATAEALEPCELKSIPRTQFLLFMQEFQAVTRNSAVAVAREYETAVLSARRLALSANAAAKLASVLVTWADGKRYSGDEEPLRFRMPLTHEELGHMSGLSRETTTRLLTRFRKEGLLRIDGEWITLLAADRLQALFE